MDEKPKISLAFKRPGAVQASPKPQQEEAASKPGVIVNDLDFRELFKEPEKLTPEGEPISFQTHETMFEFLKLGLDKSLTFHAEKGTGDLYVKRMRSMLSRLRGKARKEKRKIQVFQLTLVSIEQHETHDTVTILKNRSLTQKTTVEIRRALEALSEAAEKEAK
jgi:hypothetical protein